MSLLEFKGSQHPILIYIRTAITSLVRLGLYTIPCTDEMFALNISKKGRNLLMALLVKVLSIRLTVLMAEFLGTNNVLR